MILIPIILKTLSVLLNYKVLTYISYFSIVIGILILFIFFIHLRIEFIQDKKIDRYYSAHKKIKIKHKNNKYECSYCGNRNVKHNDDICNVCGAKFENISDISVQEILDKNNSI